MRFEDQQWYRKDLTLVTAALVPFSRLFGIASLIRHWCYRRGIFPSTRFDVPVMVVGNITAGGTGKTPCVIALARHLAAKGYHPGVVSRGFGGKYSATMVVHHNSNTRRAGDESVLLSRECRCPVVIGTDRVAAVKSLFKEFPECDVVIADDGLQHYALDRDIEIVVIDYFRQFGNGYLLPAGPLREPVARLQSVDFVVMNGGEGGNNDYHMKVKPLHWVNLYDHYKKPYEEFDRTAAHAVAGIGNPDKFFNMLRGDGYQIMEHMFPDHHTFRPKDLTFEDDLPILMTAKDAVKCEKFATERMWYLDIDVEFNHDFLNRVCERLQEHNRNG